MGQYLLVLTIWCVCVGDGYTDEDVLLLQAQVAQHADMAYRFICLSDRPIKGVDCLIPQDVECYPGWWAKVLLIKYGGELNLYIDLDSVVVGRVSRCLRQLRQGKGLIAMTPNWGQSGHGGAQSSVIAWTDSPWLQAIVRDFDPKQLQQDPKHPFGRYGNKDWWGDQGYFTAKLGNPGEGPGFMAMCGVASYKYHCRNGVPKDTSIVTFHGKPKPAEVQDAWVKAARSSTPIAA